MKTPLAIALTTAGALVATAAVLGFTYLGKLEVEPWPYNRLDTTIPPVPPGGLVEVKLNIVRTKLCPYILETRTYSGPIKVSDFRREFSTPRQLVETLVVHRQYNLSKPKWAEGRDEWRVGAMCNWWQGIHPNFNKWVVTDFTFEGLPSIPKGSKP